MKLARLVLPLSLAACGDNLEPIIEPEPTPLEPTCNETELPATLAALPNVTTAEEQLSCGDFVTGPARCFLIRFDQPIDHAGDGAKRFSQRLFLTHRGCDRPNLVADWGYSNDDFYDDELSVVFDTNALWIEHRYQGESTPLEQDWDWTALTIQNGADDMHEVIAAFRLHYGGRFVTTGASKGGITATYHKFLHPTDVDGSIPYVAPASRERVDPEYQNYLETKLPSPCATRLRDAQVAALSTRRTMMISRLSAVSPGSEALLLEYMTSHFDWAFWQYYGVSYCTNVPTQQTSDDAFYNFFATFSGIDPRGFAPPTGEAGREPPLWGPAPAIDEQMQYGALEYEWLTEQGFALQINSRVMPLLQEPFARETMEERFLASFPGVELPAHDGTVTLDARRWVRNLAHDMLLIYGQNDPWSGGAMDTPSRSTSARFFVPNATHGARIDNLIPADKAAALEIAGRLFGVAPTAFKPEARRAGEMRQTILDRRMQRQREIELHMQMRRSQPAR